MDNKRNGAGFSNAGLTPPVEKNDIVGQRLRQLTPPVTPSVKNTAGLTLIELLVAMGILGIVLTVCFSFLFFGYRSFGTGSAQFNIQSDIRIVMETVKNEVRYASEFQVIPVSEVPSTVTDGYKYIYAEGNALKFKSSAGASERLQGLLFSSGPVFTLSASGGNFILTVTLEGVYRDQDYETSTDVLIQNLEVSTAGSDNAIRYK